MITPPSKLERFDALLEIVKGLRGPGGCPWDKEQTHRSLTPYAIEEAHELAEAIEAGSETEMISELGDVLLQVVLHAEIARQEGRFDVSDVIRVLNQKMVRRHPHVFSDVKVDGSEGVLGNWAEIKKSEKLAAGKANNETSNESFDVPVSLPALARAEKIGVKTKAHRFDWANISDVLAKVDEELAELKHAISFETTEAQEHELGDVLFSLAQLARHLKLEPEQSLRIANKRFEKRFFAMKKQIAAENRNYDDLSSKELELYWQKIKKLK